MQQAENNVLPRGKMSQNPIFSADHLRDNQNISSTSLYMCFVFSCTLCSGQRPTRDWMMKMNHVQFGLCYVSSRWLHHCTQIDLACEYIDVRGWPMRELCNTCCWFLVSMSRKCHSTWSLYLVSSYLLLFCKYIIVVAFSLQCEKKW